MRRAPTLPEKPARGGVPQNRPATHTAVRPGRAPQAAQETALWTRFAHDWSGVAAYPPALEMLPLADTPIQLKAKVGRPGDRFEQQADTVAERVVGSPAIRPATAIAPLHWPTHAQNAQSTTHSPGSIDRPTPLAQGSSFGRPLDAGVRDAMGRRMGYDFGNVRIHTDAIATHFNKGLNARAFTHGSDIFFNQGEYRPNTKGGRRLLAHELTHVVQQNSMADKSAQREMIQCTTIGEILNEFFSPFSSEHLWVMPEGDNYTRIVRRWQPVIDAVNQAKADLEANCAAWSAGHRTDSSWTPGMTDPPVTDPNAHGIWVASPPGTDPQTCKDAFIIYVGSHLLLGPPVQTFELYTCSIGSFGIYVTVDSIDCATQTADMNIWMYNAMDQGSFGQYASHPAFALSGMERQYMWWNWHESHSWGAAPAPGGGSGGGSSEW
ncbi:eCIS core domain-containing protein [Desulfatitalea tepidiphila]|uniref:eCIS core domain-containing protein n=1 Tax=Desulfatitalea tepidiphila TaxID=1185843 RepID=UPI0006B5A6CE|nr:DUF4157 domain-containing protein [Desulfatitalea tepidiphila]